MAIIRSNSYVQCHAADKSHTVSYDNRDSVET